ncbi:MAG: OmpA family protein [Cyclobacteriaceae bacterium]|nr:OmpA family protein [Cyclobacteriaceae bacterium]
MKNLGYILLLIFVSGCVMQKQYDELLAEKLKLESKLQECDDNLLSANSKRDSLLILTTQLSKDTTRLGENIRTTSKKLTVLKAEHDQLNTYYNNLLNNSGKLNKDLAEQQRNLLAIKENLEKTRQLNEQLNSNLELRERKVQELEDIIAKDASAVRALKDKITNALLNFKGSDLTIEMKNGKVYVSLAEKLLFKSGSTIVDEKGVKALQQLAHAVKSQKEIEIMVEGHTDNVPISSKQKYLQDNWDLSVLRATSIVRILTKSGVSENQIVAAGKGEYSPITSNKTTIDKQKNRRTEIIIAPNLSQLFTLLNK